MVAEYFDQGEGNVKPQRRIPIRHNSEFLPSAHYVDQKTLTAHQQLELPLKSKVNMNKKKRMSKLIPHHQAIKFTNAQKSKSTIHSSRSRKFKNAKTWQPIHLSPRIFTNRSLWQRRFSSLSLGGKPSKNLNTLIDGDCCIRPKFYED